MEDRTLLLLLEAGETTLSGVAICPTECFY